jgi:predicted ATPase
VAAAPAVALLLDRAAAAGAPTAVTDADATALAAICRRLDGLPLALELAAPGLRLLTPSTLLRRLDQTGLGAGLRDLPERHRSMAAVLDWSMDLLEPEEVALFERLAVTSGGFSLDTVEALAGADADVLPALGALVEQSLVLRVPSPDDQPRFRLLEPVRQFGMRRLHASGLATATADRHAVHFHARAAAATGRPGLARGRPCQPAVGLPPTARTRPRLRCRRARRQHLALPRAARPRPRGTRVAGTARARGVRRGALPGDGRPARAPAPDWKHRVDAA